MLAVSVVSALAAGCTFAVGSVLQQSAAREAPLSISMSWRLIVDLAHRRTWLLGIGCDVGSFAMQALALAYGPLALVQPLAPRRHLCLRQKGRPVAADIWSMK